MEYEKIKQLMEDMGNSKLTSIEIDFPDGTKINMKKEAVVKAHEVATVSDIQTINTPTMNAQVVNTQAMNIPVMSEPSIQEQVIEEKFNIVKSPMVGTFYAKPSPNSESYVEVGKRVKKGDVLCIIEAMKLMNEIESEFDGEVIEILVKDGEMVEYGKPLFKIK